MSFIVVDCPEDSDIVYLFSDQDLWKCIIANNLGHLAIPSVYYTPPLFNVRVFRNELGCFELALEESGIKKIKKTFGEYFIEAKCLAGKTNKASSSQGQAR